MFRLPSLHRWRAGFAVSACLALAACATGYGGNGYPGSSGYPGNYGGQPGGQYGSQYGSQRFLAAVESVDPRYGRLLVGIIDSRGYARSRAEVFFDNNTRLYYQGREYPVGGLERGDQIAIDAVQSSGRLWATRIEVVRNVRDSGGYRY
jgi:hypothetical protein